MWLSSRNLRVKGSRKLLPRFVGPLKVISRVGPSAYRLDMGSGIFKDVHPVFHVSLLREYVSNGLHEAPPPVILEGEEEFEVEKIYGHRRYRG